MDIGNFKKSSDAIESGDWVDDIPQMGDLRLRVKGLNSAQFKAIFARKQRAVPKQQRERDGEIQEEVLHQIRGEALCEAILLDWDGLTSEGQPFPFDKETARKWLTDPDFADFHYATLYAAGVVGKDKTEAKDGLEKNSGKRSPGK